MRRSNPCGNAPVLRRRRARPPPGRKQTRPLQAAKRPRFCGVVLRQREAERIRRALSLSPGYAQKQPLRQCRSCHRRRARPSPGRKRLCPLQAAKRPRFCRTVSRQREVERIRRAIPLARVCAEVAPAAMPVLCRRRAPAARSEAPVPLASRKNGPVFAGPYRVKGKRRGSGGRPLSPPGMRRSSPCGNAGHAIDGAPVRHQVRRARAPCKQKNGPAFAGPYRVKGRRRESGGRSPSPGRWTRPAPASRPGRRRSRPGGHPRRQSR